MSHIPTLIFGCAVVGLPIIFNYSLSPTSVTILHGVELKNVAKKFPEIIAYLTTIKYVTTESEASQYMTFLEASLREEISNVEVYDRLEKIINYNMLFQQRTANKAIRDNLQKFNVELTTLKRNCIMKILDNR